MFEIAVLDAATGALLRTISLPDTFGHVPEVALSDDESQIWILTATERRVQPHVFDIRAIDAATGAELRVIHLAESPENDTSSMTARGLFVDSARGRVGISLAFADNFLSKRGEVRLFDALSGIELLRTPVSGVSWLHLSRETGTILVHSRPEFPSAVPDCGAPEIRAFFADISIPPASTLVPISIGCHVAAFASAPVAPSLSAPIVIPERTVSLAWSSMEPVTAFVLEVGSAPGLTDIGSLVVDTTTLTVPNAPAGSYHVRVRARNYIGTGQPSNEVTVVVP